MGLTALTLLIALLGGRNTSALHTLKILRGDGILHGASAKRMSYFSGVFYCCKLL